MNADEPQSPEIASLSLDYVPGPEEPEQAPLSPEYVPEPLYLEYLALSDDDIPIKYQPLPTDASLTTLSLDYITDPDHEEDPEDDPVDYPADGGDEEEEEESSRDDYDEEDEEEAPTEEDNDEEEEEHLAPADSSTVPIDDLVPSLEVVEPFETNESAPTPPSPRLHRARIAVRPQTPMAATTESLIVAVALPSSSPPPSPLTPLSSPLPQIPSPPLPLPSPLMPLLAPSSPLLLPSTDRIEDVSKADVPPRKR
ncbi:hypothetical protein Tco_0070412 [Tanacetum coccineum]